jgi:GT2 family glycosyltransferase
MDTSDETLPVTPKVAAILIARNQAAELRRALQALAASEHREQLEILVVDCASSDETAAAADEFPGVTVLRLPQHFGATKALNIATRTARAEFLLLLSPEVEVAPGTVARLAEQLEANPDTAAVCPLFVDDGGKVVARTRRWPDRESLAPVRGGGELAWTPLPEETLAQEQCIVLYPGREALMVRRQFVAGMNYFDERFGEYWADADLAMQIRRAGRKIRLYPGIRAVWHGAGKADSDDVVHKSDRIVGAAALLGKHTGFLAGFGFRWAAIFSALIHLDFSLFSALLGGTKLGAEASRSYPT